MKAYIIHQSDLGTDYWGEGMYALITEKEEVIYKRWCTNRAFANHDLTNGVENMLREHGVTDVWSNGVLVWNEGVLSAEAESAFLAANYEYELENSDYSINKNYILIFPTEEMRDAFYENFKSEIEICKELL